MTKNIKLTVITLFTLLVLVISCKKNELSPKTGENIKDSRLSLNSISGMEADNPEQVAFYSEYFINDSSMALVFEKFMTNSIIIRGTVLQHGGNSSLAEWENMIHHYSSYGEVNEFYFNLGIDSISMKEKHAETLASWLNLLVKNPNFNNLSKNDQTLVLTNIQATLSQEDFEIQNPENILVKSVRGILNSNPDLAQRSISMGEATACVISAVAGQIVNGWDTIKELVNVINNVNLGWSGIKNLAANALGSILGTNVGVMLINFGICMVLAYIF